jgi:transcriptional regulator with XRE-family HTH domain
MELGERIRLAREGQGMSQRELASAGVSYAYISRIENGDRTPSDKAIRAIASKLNVDPHWLATGDLDGTYVYVRFVDLFDGEQMGCTHCMQIASELMPSPAHNVPGEGGTE